MANAAKEYSAMVPNAILGKLGDSTITAGTNIVHEVDTTAIENESSSTYNEALEKQRKVVEEGLKRQVESYERQIADLTIGGSKLLAENAKIEKAAIDSLADKDKSSSGGGKDKSKEGKE
jgi:hypothetical protein